MMKDQEKIVVILRLKGKNTDHGLGPISNHYSLVKSQSFFKF